MTPDLSWLRPLVPNITDLVQPAESGNTQATPALPADNPPENPPSQWAHVPLETLIDIAAEVWTYDDDDHRRVAIEAERDPAGMRLSLLNDPQVESRLRARLERAHGETSAQDLTQQEATPPQPAHAKLNGSSLAASHAGNRDPGVAPGCRHWAYATCTTIRPPKMRVMEHMRMIFLTP